MGAEQSSSVDTRRQVNGSIQVNVQKTGFIGGEVIQGILSVNLQESYPGHILQISLEGIEETHFSYSVSQGSGQSRRSKTIYARGLNKFLDFAIPVYDFAQVGQTSFSSLPGKWQIPFSIDITPYLPSSLNFTQSSYVKCALKYRVVGTLIPTQATEVRPLQGSQEIFIARQVDILQVEPMKQQQASPQVCKCCSSGQMNISVQGDKAAYTPGELVQVHFDYDARNYGSTVKSLNLIIRGNLQMKANNGRTHSIIKEVVEITVPVTSKQFSGNENIQLPSTISLSCEGDFINLSYYLIVRPVIDSCCSYVPDSIGIPIRINPTPTTLRMIEVPSLVPSLHSQQQWNPTQLSPTIFSPHQTSIIQQQQEQIKQVEQQLITKYLEQNRYADVESVPLKE